jgi:uncharacterized C2H2 Zn-finger protein
MDFDEDFMTSDPSLMDNSHISEQPQNAPDHLSHSGSLTMSEVEEAECHKCDKCERCFESKWKLNRHIKRAHLKKYGKSIRAVPEDYRCKICN